MSSDVSHGKMGLLKSKACSDAVRDLCCAFAAIEVDSEATPKQRAVDKIFEKHSLAAGRLRRTA